MPGAFGKTRLPKKSIHAWAQNNRTTASRGIESKLKTLPERENSMKAPFLIGRLIFGGFFIYSGIHHFVDRKMLSSYSAAKNVPMPDVAVAATGAALVIGGASILAGVKPRLGTAAVIGFLAGVSPVMHDFWRKEDPQERTMEMVNFSKNMALLGGALALMGVEEPWPVSVPVAQPKRSRLKKLFGAAA
jgi:putative oxidoreductase